MNKDIEMFAISDKEEQIGTQIFDPNLPSNIDFEDNHEQTENVPINPEKVARLTKIITIGEEMKSYKVLGKALAQEQPRFFIGAIVNAYMQTYSVKVYDEEKGAGLKKIWQSIVGFSKREIAISEGHIYLLQRRKQGLFLYQLHKLSKLFKIFIDPEEDKVRLIFKEGERLFNKDISPDRFLSFLDALNQELARIGLGLEG